MSDDFKESFTEVGELLNLPDGGLAIRLTFGKPLKRVLQHLFDKKLMVSFQPAKYQRSHAQNRWLWGVAYTTIIAWYKETQGESISKDAIHAHTLHNIVGHRLTATEVLGKEVVFVEGKSTSQLTTKEFSDMVERLQQFWAEKGCDIPSPRGNNFLSDFISDQ